MEFNTFVEKTRTTIKDYLPQEFESSEVVIETYRKLNQEYLGLRISPKIPGNVMCPNVNLNEIYKEASDFGYSFEKSITEMAQIISSYKIMEDEVKNDYESVKDKLFVRVSNAERNQELLKNVPHMMVTDLVLTYHVAVDIQETGIASTIVDRRMLEKWNISEKELHIDALESSANIFPVSICPLSNIIGDIGINEVSLFPPLWIVKNETSINGASALFYPGVLEEIGEKLKSNFFILPSSVHEFLIHPDNGNVSPEELKEMVHQVNDAEVTIEEQLSDSVYYYDTESTVFIKL